MTKNKKHSDDSMLSGGILKLDESNITAADKDSGEIEAVHDILPYGTFAKRTFFGKRKFTVSEKLADEMIETVAADRKEFGEDMSQIPIDINHAFDYGDLNVEGNEAQGWVTDIMKGSKAIQLKIRWLPHGVERIRSKKFRMLSAVWAEKFFDNAGDVVNRAKLFSATLTNRPFFKSAKAGTMLTLTTEDGTVILCTNKTDDDHLSEEPSMNEEEIKKLQTDFADLKTAAEIMKTEKSEVDAEVKKLKEEIGELKIANQMLADEKVQSEAKVAVETLVTGGKIKKSQEKFFTDMYLKDKDMFEEYVKTAEKQVPVDDPQGQTTTDGDSPDATAEEAFSKAVDEMVEKHKCTAEEAMAHVKTEKPDIFNAYHEGCK